MTKLIEEFLSESSDNPELTSLIENLEHFFSKTVSADVRGLEEKLEASNRADLLKDALARKQAATKLIMKNQASRAAQLIFTHVLAEILMNFEHNVRPAIQANAPRTEVDKAILDHVLSPAFNALEDNPLRLTKLDIQSLLYFLGGNCHIRWDPC